jgi:hypothetical protein
VAIPYRAIWHRPAGNLMASPRELAALVQLGLGRGRYGGTQLISAAGMARIERSETAWLDAGDASYGLGNYGDAVMERALIRGHNGGIDGFLSSYGYLPDHNVGYVLLLNSTRSGRAQLEIRHLLVEYLLADAPIRQPAPVPVPETELRRWAGTYHHAAPRHQLFAFLDRTLPGLEVFVASDRLYVRTVPELAPPLELVPLGDDRFRVPEAVASHIHFGRDPGGRRSLVADNAYFVEEPRARTLGFFVVPRVCVLVLVTGLGLPLAAFRRRRRRSPGIGWPFCTSVALLAVPHLFLAAAGAGGLGEPNVHTIGVFVLTLGFAAGSIGSAVQALVWLSRPGSIAGKVYRLVFAIAASAATAYLAAYGIIGVRLWSY